MSERVTLLGTEYVHTTSNNARVTLLGTEYVYKVLIPRHAISGYLRDKIVNHIFRSAIFAKPFVLFVALYTAMPSETEAGTEVTGGGYARVGYGPLNSFWSAPSAGDGTTENLSDVTFPVPSAPWGFVIGYGILDAAVGGNLLMYATLDTPRTVGTGSNPRFAAGALTATFD